MPHMNAEQVPPQEFLAEQLVNPDDVVKLKIKSAQRCDDDRQQNAGRDPADRPEAQNGTELLQVERSLVQTDLNPPAAPPGEMNQPFFFAKSRMKSASALHPCSGNAL